MELITRRLVLFFPGFEPLDASAHHGRFVRASELTGKVWESLVSVGPLTAHDGLASFEIADGEGPAHTLTQFVICDLAPVMRLISARALPVRISRGLFALASFILNGTLFAYLRTSWRYGLFFLYPLVMLGIIALAAYAAGAMLASLAVSASFALVGAFCLFAALLHLACAKAHFLLMMDLWTYARTLALEHDTPEMRATRHLLERARSVVLAQSGGGSGGSDEIILCGHSIGAALAVQLAAEIAARAPDFAAPVHVLTLGSGLLQVACHPKADRLRAMAKRLLAAKTHWLDVQALIDPINFLASDLARLYGCPSDNYRETVVRMRHLLTPATYQRIKFNLFRVHRQYVLPVEMKQRFSFHRIVSGATPFAQIVRCGGLPEPDGEQEKTV